MLTETSFQAQFLIPLAATLVFGLLLATIMVLILIPVYYVVYGRLALGDRSPMHGPLPYDKPKTVRSQSVPVASAT
jgi:hypothetical protein